MDFLSYYSKSCFMNIYWDIHYFLYMNKYLLFSHPNFTLYGYISLTSVHLECVMYVQMGLNILA